MTQSADVFDLAGAMSRVAGIMEECLDGLLPPVPGLEARLVEAMRYAALGGGKRMRAFLVMETAALFSVAETCAARVAASIEMLHAYSLVHDDLPAMDDDDLRRGKPSTHKAFDEATAILAGDALQARAFEVLAEPETHSDAAARCELVLALGHAAGARGMAGGQMIDMRPRAACWTAAEVTRLQALKTGRLIQFSAEAGAILGRALPGAAPGAGGLWRAISAPRSRSPTTCWTPKAPPRRPARPPARTPRRERRRWLQSWALKVPAPMRLMLS